MLKIDITADVEQQKIVLEFSERITYLRLSTETAEHLVALLTIAIDDVKIGDN